MKTSTRPLWWVALVLSAVANGATSSSGLNPLIGIGFGLVTLACVVVLVLQRRPR